MLQSIEISDSEIPSTVGYIPQVVTIIDVQRTNLDGGIIPRVIYTVKSVFIKKEGGNIGMYVCLV